MKVKATDKLNDYRGGVLFAMYALDTPTVDELRSGKIVDVDKDAGSRMCSAGLAVEVKSTEKKKETIKEKENGH